MEEYQKIEELLEKSQEENNKLKNIGVISPYKGQVNILQKMIEENNWEQNIEVNTVDGFQGKEKDIIFITTVRSKDSISDSIGFLKDYRRLNVAITRAKYALIIIGDRDFLKKNKIWKRLIKFIEKND